MWGIILQKLYENMGLIENGMEKSIDSTIWNLYCIYKFNIKVYIKYR